MRITTDRDRCIGSGNCAFYGPSTFDLDDELKVIVLPGAEDASADGVENIRAAVEACPVKPLGLVDGDVEQPAEGDD